MKKLLIPFLATGVVLLVSGLSWATPPLAPCPAIGQADGCNVVITLSPGPTATIVVCGQPAYDGVEDQLVGVINNSGGAVGCRFNEQDGRRSGSRERDTRSLTGC